MPVNLTVWGKGKFSGERQAEGGRKSKRLPAE
jgi:hypothetical protein